MGAGVYEPVEGEMAIDPERMERIAMVKALEPDIPNMRLARELGMARSSALRYLRHLAKFTGPGGLDLSQYAGEPAHWAASSGGEYDSTKSLDLTLQLIQGQKMRLQGKMKAGKSVSTQQILQLTDAEKKLLSIPQRAEDVPKDFYDQLDGRVPVRESDEGSEARRRADFEELGEAGDLSGGELDEEQTKEACDA